ncbi:radical SAM protein [Proteinivorax tanatarense]|uniref:Radical SAM protein n=1 Tax=Proteinivorax tanatarense TaxID=1260629 RepID=A0AAU7VNJ8_9FIRM
MSVIDQCKRYALVNLYRYMDKNPDKNLPKLVKWGDRIDKQNQFVTQRKIMREIIEDEENHWNQLIKSLWTDVDDELRRKLFENFFLNATLLGFPKQRKLEEKHDCNIPWAILLDPTSACNLDCTGCWASEYGDKLNLDFETLDSIIEQAKELGIHFFLFSGGEPLVRKKDIIKLCEKHNDCAFLAFTNGTLIDEEFAEEMLRVKNFIPAFSIEGFEEETDYRRGKGTYSKILEAMKILKNKKLPFGVSCCYTSKNTESIGSEEFIDQIIAWGAKFAWFFTYMPVGVDAAPELMATDKQRKFMYHQIRKFRKTKPLFTMDFWNDGQYAKGCVAGGRRYLHINSNGDCEPCAFVHYSDSNIKNKTLLEALKSPLFKGYRKNQPFNKNHLRPCPILDNPGRLTDIVDESGATSTDFKDPEDVRDLSKKCEVTAEKWATTAEQLWNDS